MPKLSLKSKISQILKCPICFDQFKSPKTLPCHHSFCGPCLDNLVNQKECPVCRGKVTSKKLAGAKASKDLTTLLKAVKEDDQAVVAKLVAKFESFDGAEPKGTAKDAKKKEEKATKPKRTNHVLQRQNRKKQQMKVMEEMLAAEYTDAKSMTTQCPTPNVPKPKESKKSDKPKSILKTTVNRQPNKLSKKDQKLFKNELTPESSSDEDDSESDGSESTNESTSEDEGTTRDISSSSGEEGESGDSDSSDSDSSDGESDTDSDTSTEDGSSGSSDEMGSDSDTEEEIEYKRGKEVAIFPQESSNRKKHINGVVKFKTTLPGHHYSVYGVHVKKGTTVGMGIKLTGKQVKALSEKEQKWWAEDKKKKMWVESYRLCHAKLVSDI